MAAGIRNAAFQPALPMSIPTNCSRCGATVERATKTRLNYLDVFGVVVVGGIVLAFLSIFLSSGRGRLVMLVAGLVGFGLYYMIGTSKSTVLRCSQCGHAVDLPEQGE